ncbi:MAG: hypothetical protein ABEJ93_02385 [Candidatus Nanohalobium sp.]
MAFLIDRLKEKFDVEDGEYDRDSFNYKVGNTSGMDVTQQIPSEIAQRVGQMAQRGGGTMEIQVENPTTFYIDRESLYEVIDGLGLDISIHSDPNIGYTSAYKTGRGRGFDVVQGYFRDYLESFASFKQEMKNREDINFKLSRINPHVSTSPQPPLHERMADDVGLDPFGYKISDLSEELMGKRSEKGQNIFKNKEFLRKLYHTFLLEEVDYDFQYFSLFARYSKKFEKKWNQAQREATNEYYRWRTNPENGKVEDLTEAVSAKLSVIRTSQGQDRGIETAWFELLDKHGDTELPLLNIEFEHTDEKGLQWDYTVEETEESVNSILAGRENLALQRAPERIYSLRENPKEVFEGPETRYNPNPGNLLIESTVEGLEDLEDEQQGEVREKIERKKEAIAEEEGIFEEAVRALEESLVDALDELWEGNGEEEMSVDAKIAALSSHFDIQKMKIQELAFELDEEGELEESAEKVLMGEKEYFEQEGPEEDMGVDNHAELLRHLIASNFEQQIWMESNLFYRVFPAWMSSADTEYPGHNGFKAPKFIWETLVERKWEDRFELDLTDARGGEDEKKYLDMLEESAEFRSDVAAASAACVMWSHFTQIEQKFEMEGNQYIQGDNGVYTWIEWMNKYGIGVNMEAMAGSPSEKFKLWRPKDIVAACRAVNITAREEVEDGELGGKESIDEELDGSPVKFTIDMEHTAGFGVDPWEEMEKLIEQEKWLAEQDFNVKVDKDKPLAHIVRMYHLTKPGLETSQGTGHTHGPFRKGDVELYEWLYNMAEAGFAQNPGEEASVMYEVGGEQTATVVQAQLAMDMIELGISPDELDPSKVDPDTPHEDEKEALMAKFFRMDRPNYNREWAKIEEHAFDPLDGLLQAQGFDFTWSGNAAIQQGENRPNEWKQEEYQ